MFFSFFVECCLERIVEKKQKYIKKPLMPIPLYSDHKEWLARFKERRDITITQIPPPIHLLQQREYEEKRDAVQKQRREDKMDYDQIHNTHLMKVPTFDKNKMISKTPVETNEIWKHEWALRTGLNNMKSERDVHATYENTRGAMETTWTSVDKQ